MTSLVLKIIAVLAMLCDHTALALYIGGQLPAGPLYIAMRAIGRIAFPMFGFLIAEGARHTKNKAGYALRMLLMVPLSELPFDMVLGVSPFSPGAWEYQNVYITLLAGLLTIFTMQWAFNQTGRRRVLGAALSVAVFFSAVVFCVWSRSDYDYAGVVMITVFGLLALPLPQAEMGGLPSKIWTVGISALAIFLMAALTFPMEYFSLFALIPIALYNGKRGYSSRALQYGFYLFYPAHLLILALLFVVPGGLS